MVERLKAVLDSRPEVADEDKVDENYMRLQLKTAINFMQQQEAALKRERTRVTRAVKVINSLGKFIANFGFRKVGEVYGEDYTHNSLSGCLCCGHQPVIQESSYVTGNWLVKCPKCDLMTDPKPKIVGAIKAWNNKEFSEASVMFNRRYSKETLDENGMMELAQEACRIAADDYRDGNASMREDITKFLQTSDFLMRIDRDALIEELEKEVAEKQKAGA